MNAMKAKTRLLDSLKSITGLEIFYVYCGLSTGSVLDIHFHPIKSRSQPLGNPSLSKLHRENQGSLALFVECTWRLQASNKFVLGSGDSSGGEEDIFTPLQSMAGMVVSEVLLPNMSEIFDFSLRLQDDSGFKIFCDANTESYSVFSEDCTITVEAGGNIRIDSEQE
jgi:hypothetical protein